MPADAAIASRMSASRARESLTGARRRATPARAVTGRSPASVTTSTRVPNSRLEIDQQRPQVDQAASRLQIDQQIEVAGRIGLAPRNRPEHAQIVRAVPRRQIEQPAPLAAHRLQGHHGRTFTGNVGEDARPRVAPQAWPGRCRRCAEQSIHPTLSRSERPSPRWNHRAARCKPANLIDAIDFVYGDNFLGQTLLIVALVKLLRAAVESSRRRPKPLPRESSLNRAVPPRSRRRRFSSWSSWPRTRASLRRRRPPSRRSARAA